MTEKEFEHELYQSYFKKAYRHYQNMKQNDDDYNWEDMNQHLNTLYVQEGNDWVGKGELLWMKSSATIAACETVLSEWEDEIRNQEAVNEYNKN